MLSLITWAQPGNLKNTAKSMFNITTYDAQGAICTVAKGVFTSTDGKAIAPWSALAHAQHATITTIDGATYNVQSIIGISELYDVCHITTTATATTPVSISSKIIVGKLMALLIMALSESITRAISPPDATCDIA